jgi:hypothetical protein
MKRLLLVAILAAAVALTTTALARPTQQPPDPVPPLPPLPTPGAPLPAGQPPGAGALQYVLRVGDTMRVEGASLGCQVTRRAARVVVECRPAGALRGRYGTLLSNRTATVARFRSSRTARVVFSAKHRGGWRACREPASASAAAHAAAGGCR